MRTVSIILERVLQLVKSESSFLNWLILITAIAFILLLLFCGIGWLYIFLSGKSHPGFRRFLQGLNKVVLTISAICSIVGIFSIYKGFFSEKTSVLIAYCGLLSTIINFVFGFILRLFGHIPVFYKAQFCTIEKDYENLSLRLMQGDNNENGKDKLLLYRFIIEECLKSIAGLLEKSSVDEQLSKKWLAAKDDDRKKIETMLSYGKNTLMQYSLMAHFRESKQQLLAHSMYDLCHETYTLFIEHLSSSNPLVPDFFAHSYDEAILSFNMTEQRCTSLYNLKRFYDFYKDRGFTLSQEATYERIFLLNRSDIQIYPVLKFDIIQSLYDVLNLLLPKRVNVRFITKAKANGIKTRIKYPSNRLDFSISKIEDNKFLVLSLGQETKKDFFDKKIPFYELYGEEEGKDGVTCKFYEELRTASLDSEEFVDKNLEYWATNGNPAEQATIASFRVKFNKLRNNAR